MNQFLARTLIVASGWIALAQWTAAEPEPASSGTYHILAIAPTKD